MPSRGAARGEEGAESRGHTEEAEYCREPWGGESRSRGKLSGPRAARGDTNHNKLRALFTCLLCIPSLTLQGRAVLVSLMRTEPSRLNRAPEATGLARAGQGRKPIPHGTTRPGLGSGDLEWCALEWEHYLKKKKNLSLFSPDSKSKVKPLWEVQTLQKLATWPERQLAASPSRSN